MFAKLGDKAFHRVGFFFGIGEGVFLAGVGCGVDFVGGLECGGDAGPGRFVVEPATVFGVQAYFSVVGVGD